MKKVLIIKTLLPFVRNDIDLFADELCRRFIKNGQDSEVLRIPFNVKQEKQLSQAMLSSILEVWNTDLLITLDYPSCLIRNKNHVAWLHEALPWKVADASSYCLMSSLLCKYLPNAKQVYVSSAESYTIFPKETLIKADRLSLPADEQEWKDCLKMLLAHIGDESE